MEFSILYELQELHTPLTDVVMTMITTLGNKGIIWIAIAVSFLCVKKTRRCGLQMLVCMLICLIVGNGLLKNIVARPRPCWLDESVPMLIRIPTDYSFPSGHAMHSFTAAATIFLYNRKVGIIALVLAALIAFSRLYLFVHFPTDVAAGILIGIITALLVGRFAGKQKNIEERV